MPLLSGFCSDEDAPPRLGSSLLCRRQPHRDCTVLMLVGEIDCVTAPALRRELAAVIDENEGPVIVDVALVTSSDGAGLYTLLMGSRTRWVPGSICLAGPSGAVRQALARAQVQAVLPVYDTANDAVAVLAERCAAKRRVDDQMTREPNSAVRATRQLSSLG
jgi:anti-anti-sigma factor